MNVSDLYSRYGRGLMLMLLNRTYGDEQLAEDIHQETFLILFERLSGRGLNEPDKVKSFIYGTAINLLKNDVRGKRRRATYPDSDAVVRQQDQRADQLRKLLQEESDLAVRKMVDELRMPRDREVIRRFYILEHDKAEICAALSLKPREFDSVISRARRRFKSLIEKLDD